MDVCKGITRCAHRKVDIPADIAEVIGIVDKTVKEGFSGKQQKELVIRLKREILINRNLNGDGAHIWLGLGGIGVVLKCVVDAF